MANAVEKVISIALDEVGYLEKKSNSQLDDKTANVGANNYTKYARDLDNISGFYNGKKNGAAWCDVFTDWCFVQAFGADKAKELLCQPSKSSGAGCLYSMNYYKKNKQFYEENPNVGDQIFFWNSAKTGIAHTGIVYDVDNTYVYTVEGNTRESNNVVANGGGVHKKKYALSYSVIAGYGRPDYSIVEQASVVISRNYLMKGDKGEEVKVMQENLIKLGYSCGSTGADGDFGSKTDSAVRAFQKENGLVVDGKYGEQSKAKVESLLKKIETPISNKIDTVKEVQSWVNNNYKFKLVVDGIYGVKTKRTLIKILQTELNSLYKSELVIDGVWGIKTREACPTLKIGNKNNIVGVLQAMLICNGYSNAYLDKIYGSGTYSVVKSYQKKNGLAIDGLAGKNTFAKLCS